MAFLGLIGFIGIFGFLNGSWDWFIFFPWFIWFVWVKKPADERFYINIDKAARNGFIIAMIGISVILGLMGFKIPYRYIIIAAIILFEILLIGFISSFFYYEKKGY
jgi:hypothetical protein